MSTSFWITLYSELSSPTANGLSLYLSWASSSSTAPSISVETEPAVKRAQRPNRVDCLIVLAAYNVSHSTVQSRHPHTHTHSTTAAGREGEAWSIYTFSFKACRSTGGVRFLVVALCFRRVVRTDAVNKQWREWSGGRLVSLPIVVACVAMTALCWNNRDYRLCHHDWKVSPMLCYTHLNYLVSSVVFAWLLSFTNRLFHLRIHSFVWFENVSWLI